MATKTDEAVGKIKWIRPDGEGVYFQLAGGEILPSSCFVLRLTPSEGTHALSTALLLGAAVNRQEVQVRAKEMYSSAEATVDVRWVRVDF